MALIYIGIVIIMIITILILLKKEKKVSKTITTMILATVPMLLNIVTEWKVENDKVHTEKLENNITRQSIEITTNNSINTTDELRRDFGPFAAGNSSDIDSLRERVKVSIENIEFDLHSLEGYRKNSRIAAELYGSLSTIRESLKEDTVKIDSKNYADSSYYKNIFVKYNYWYTMFQDFKNNNYKKVKIESDVPYGEYNKYKLHGTSINMYVEK